MIKGIRDNILTRMASVLSTGYSKLSFMDDIAKNKFSQANKRYGANIGGSSSVSGVVGKNTYDHTFSLVITDTYQKGQVLNDEYKQEVVAGLQDKAMSIYRDLQTNKSSIATNCLIISGFTMSEPAFLDEEKVVIQRFNINVKYTN